MGLSENQPHMAQRRLDIHEDQPADQQPGPSHIQGPPPQLFQHPTSEPSTTPQPPNLRIKSHNLNKQKPEAFVHGEGWDICFYQELTRAPSLPFDSKPHMRQPKVFSSVLPAGDEGACIVVSAHLAPYVFDMPSPSPGALCTAMLHLPGLPPVLLVSVYAQPPRRAALEKALNGLFAKYPRYLAGGDFNAQLSSLDTNGVTENRRRWLNTLLNKQDAVDTFRVKHPDARVYTRYKSAVRHQD